MTQEELLIKKDRMRYTKDSLSSNLVLLAIVLDALYFVAVYQLDVGSYYYNWVIGASIIYNLLFLLSAFLASEGVKNRKTGYTGLLIFIGVMQIVRIFYLPMRAHSALVAVNGVEVAAMGNGKYFYAIVCLAVSAVCCIAAAVISYRNNKTLADYMRSLEKSA
ncbi:MAG: hypothetical protein ACI4PH_04965 [Faecousia sp.]